MKLVVVFLLIIVHVESADINRLTTIPWGMENLDLEKLMGRWHLYATKPPYSWLGAAYFKDWTHTFHLDWQAQNIIIEDSWRKDGPCTFTTALETPATYRVRDQLGDVWSGIKILMYTDYTNYAIAWGCTKQSGHIGKCDDYWYDVKSRQPNLSQRYLNEINKKLEQFWGTSLSEMSLIHHSQPCGGPVQRSARMGVNMEPNAYFIPDYRTWLWKYSIYNMLP